MTTFDKAKYHFETIQKFNLPEISAYIHTGFYLGWLVENNLIDDEFFEDCEEDILRFTQREITAPQLFKMFDGCLDDEMLSQEGLKFTEAYFDFTNGRYISDYQDNVVKTHQTEFHVADTWENYDTVKNFVSKRYKEWKLANSK